MIYAAIVVIWLLCGFLAHAMDNTYLIHRFGRRSKKDQFEGMLFLTIGGPIALFGASAALFETALFSTRSRFAWIKDWVDRNHGLIIYMSQDELQDLRDERKREGTEDMFYHGDF